MNSEIESIYRICSENLSHLSNVRIEKISGDASSRRYYRITTSEENLICSMDKAGSQQNRDYVLMTEDLSRTIKVPKIFFHDDSISVVIQEDLGDLDLNKFIATIDSSERTAYYEKCLEKILAYQMIDHKKVHCRDLYFDRDKISFELNLTKNYFQEKYLGLASKCFDSFYETIIDHFEKNKKVVCHRDFHGRNLHVKNGEIYSIDFQDARIGPRTYDLASFLEDSYFSKTENEKIALKKSFYSKVQNNYNSFEEFERDYDLVAIERVYKAIGSFCYLKEEKGLTRYEKYIGFAFERLRSLLEKYSEFDAFRVELVGSYYEH